VGRLAAAIQAVDQAMASYRFNDAANALYHCVWGEFCDWYLEFTKPIFQGGDEATQAETRATTAWVLGQLLHLLHPFMPFLTEELWEQVGLAGSGSLISADWPKIDAAAIDAAATADLDWVIRLVSGVRALRIEMNVPPAAQISLILRDADTRTADRLTRYNDLICRLARASGAQLLSGDAPKGAAQIVLDEATILMPLSGVIDVAQETARLKKEFDKAAAEAEKLAKKLGNEQFVAKAKPEVVEEQRQRLADMEQACSKLQLAMDRLAAL
jgi:valyl-tRNA synthetase